MVSSRYKVEKLTPEQDVEISILHKGGVRLAELGRRFNVFPSSIRAALKRQGATVTTWKNPVHEDVFDEIEDELTSYWLGFIYADGCVSQGKYNSYTFSVKLKASDKAHLDKLRKFLGIAELHETKSVAKEKSHPQYVLRSSNSHLCERLKNIGISVGRQFPEKTLNVIPHNLLNHFFRGLFDGDGCAQRIPGFTFLSQKEVLEKLREELIKAGASPVRKVRETGNICRIDYGGFQQALKIKEYLYQDATVFLERKLDIVNGWSQQTATIYKRKYHRQITPNS